MKGGAIYRDYDEFKFLIVSTLMKMIKHTRGNVLTFNTKKIAVYANIETHPVILTLVKDVLENLRKEGYIRRLGKSRHGIKYMINRDSPLWKAAKDDNYIKELETPYLKTVIAKITEK